MDTSATRRYPVENLVFAAVALLWISAALANFGFFALDDYTHGLAQVLPAQNYPHVDHIIALSGYRSPVPNLILWAQSRAALALGITDPAWQVRFLFACAALLSLAGLRFSARHFDFDRRYRPFYWSLCGFFFLSPFLFSRTLVEVYSGTFIALSSACLCRYFAGDRRALAVWATVWLAVAAQMRFQSGVCALPLALCVIGRRDRRAVVYCLIAGLGLAFLIGAGDKVMKGEYFASLKFYWNWHRENFATAYGKAQPPYLFALLFVGLSLPPVFFSRYRGLDFRRVYGPLLPCLAYWATFVILHSFAAHKEERFMIPVLPLFFVLLAPLAAHLWARPRQRRWRLAVWLSINGVLVLPVSLSTNQYNVVGLARYLEAHPSVRRVYAVETTLGTVPAAYITRSVERVEMAPADVDAALAAADCDSLVAIRRDFLPKYPRIAQDFAFVEEFRPGWTEALVVKMNPGKNSRRGPILAYVKNGCTP